MSTEVVVQSIPNLRRTQHDIKVAVRLWCRDPAAAEAMYGHISLWDTEAVTNMESLFMEARDFQEDISDWNVSNVVSMEDMFCNARGFNCDISGWDTARVTNMAWMFHDAHSFLFDLSEWNISAVSDMYATFEGCPVDFEAVWLEHRGDPVWEENSKQNRQLRHEQKSEQRRRDANWARRRAWMMVISPFLRRSGVTESPLQVVFDVQGLYQLITSFV